MPVRIGSKIWVDGFPDDFGTLGALAILSGNVGQDVLYAVASSHVLALVGVDKGARVFAQEPGGIPIVIGLLDTWTGFPQPPVSGEAALVWVDPTRVSNEVLGTEPNAIKRFSDTNAADKDDQVRVYGAGSAATKVGTVQSASGTADLSGFAYTDQLFCVAPVELSQLTVGGDSGAPVVNSNGELVGFVAGDLVQGDKHNTVVMKIDNVLNHSHWKPRQLGILLDPPVAGRFLVPSKLDAPPATPAPTLVGVQGMLSKLHTPPVGSGNNQWRMTSRGIQLNGTILRTNGDPTTATNVWKMYQPTIEAAATEYGVPLELIVATICTESGGKPDSVRPEPKVNDSSQGVMQTLLGTARLALGDPSLKLDDLRDPRTSIRAGTSYVKIQRNSTSFDPPLVAIAYNAGSLKPNANTSGWGLVQTARTDPGPWHADTFTAFFNDFLFILMSGGSAPPHSDTPSFRSISWPT